MVEEIERLPILAARLATLTGGDYVRALNFTSYDSQILDRVSRERLLLIKGATLNFDSDVEGDFCARIDEPIELKVDVPAGISGY